MAAIQHLRSPVDDVCLTASYQAARRRQAYCSAAVTAPVPADGTIYVSAPLEDRLKWAAAVTANEEYRRMLSGNGRRRRRRVVVVGFSAADKFRPRGQNFATVKYGNRGSGHRPPRGSGSVGGCDAGRSTRASHHYTVHPSSLSVVRSCPPPVRGRRVPGNEPAPSRLLPRPSSRSRCARNSDCRNCRSACGRRGVSIQLGQLAGARDILSFRVGSLDLIRPVFCQRRAGAVPDVG